MRKSLFILFLLSMTSNVMAQEMVRKKEIGLAFSSLNSFGIAYRTGTNKYLWRFQTLFISGGNTVDTADSLVRKQSNSGFGFKMGREYRKELADNLELRFGADISFAYSKYNVDRDDRTINNADKLDQRTSYSAGVNLVFGFNYTFNGNFVIGAEVLPSFTYSKGIFIERYSTSNNVDQITSDISGFNYGLSNTSALLSLMYRF
jgi:hypothetical protein